MTALESYRVQGLPAQSVFYVPDFVSEQEELNLVECVERAPRTKWVHLANRSLQQFGGEPRHNGMLVETMPHWLQPWLDRMNAMNLFDGNPANHVLMNRYQPGQGIMPHTDGPLYHPVVCTINTNQHTVLNFYRRNSVSSSGDKCSVREYAFSILLQPRSLFVVQDELYTSYEHGIDELHHDHLKIVDLPVVINLNVPDHHNSVLYSACEQEIELERSKSRYSFTVRHVPKVIHSKLADWILKK